MAKRIFIWIGSALYCATAAAGALPPEFRALLQEFSPAPKSLFIAESCESYPTNLPIGGAAQLEQDFVQGLETGFRCLLGLSDMGPLGAAHVEQAYVLKFVLEQFRPLRVSCGFHSQFWNALSTAPGVPMTYLTGKPQYPEIQLYLQNIHANQRGELPALLFHEMLHWTGLTHPSGSMRSHKPDLVNLYEMCCFGSKDIYGRRSLAMERARTQACGFLKSTHKGTWGEQETLLVDQILEVYKLF